jgi:hypothetical protein
MREGAEREGMGEMVNMAMRKRGAAIVALIAAIAALAGPGAASARPGKASPPVPPAPPAAVAAAFGGAGIVASWAEDASWAEG